MISPRDRLVVPVARRSTVEHAVKVNALRQLARDIGIAEAVGVLATMDDRTTPRERAAEARKSRRSAVLAEYGRLTKLGYRDAAARTARKFDGGDLVERQNLARNIHRWRRKETPDNVRSPSAKSG